MTSSAAPPCDGPERAAIPAVIAPCISALVPETTLAVKAEAFEPWSAWRTKSLSIRLMAF